MNVYNFRIKIYFIYDILVLLFEVLANLPTDWCYRQAKSVFIYKKKLLY